MLQITNNLKLEYVYENNVVDNKLIAVECAFHFFGEESVAYVAIDRIENETATYAMTETTSGLGSSFNEVLAEKDNWDKIRAKIKEYANNWKLENS